MVIESQTELQSGEITRCNSPFAINLIPVLNIPDIDILSAEGSVFE